MGTGVPDTFNNCKKKICKEKIGGSGMNTIEEARKIINDMTKFFMELDEEQKSIQEIPFSPCYTKNYII